MSWPLNAAGRWAKVGSKSVFEYAFPGRASFGTGRVSLGRGRAAFFVVWATIVKHVNAVAQVRIIDLIPISLSLLDSILH